MVGQMLLEIYTKFSVERHFTLNHESTMYWD